MSDIPNWVESGIAVATRPTEPNPVIESRYPHTYAYDYVRSHPEAFDLPTDLLSRAGVAGWLRDRLDDDSRSPEHVKVVRALADAYIRENNLVWRDGSTPESAIEARSTVHLGRYSWV
jgi:hypothetical protein